MRTNVVNVIVIIFILVIIGFIGVAFYSSSKYGEPEILKLCGVD